MNEEAKTEPITAVKQMKNNYLLSNGKLVPRITRVLNVLPKPALIHWAANEEREYCVQKLSAFVSDTLYNYSESGRLKEDMDANYLTRDKVAEMMRHRLGEAKDPETGKWKGKKAHQMKLKKATDIGKELHDAIQDALKVRLGESPPRRIECSEPAALAFMAWEDWAASVELDPIMVEQMIGSDRMGVGGTTDCVARFVTRSGNFDIERVGVWDWKTSKRSSTAPDGIYFEAKIQVSVYREILIEMGVLDHDSVAGIVRLPKDIDDPVIQSGQPVDWLVLEPEEASRLARGFLSIRDVWEFLETENR